MASIYYLETSSMYPLSKYLIEDNAASKAICFSSFLVVFELLSGLKEDNYKKRKAILRNLIDSRIEINWYTPREIIAEAFQEVLLFDGLKNRIRKLANLVLQSSSYDSLNQLSERDDSVAPLEKLAEMDVLLTVDQSGEVQKQIVQLRKDVSKEKIKEITDILESNPSFREQLRKVDRDTLLGRLAAYVAFKMPGKPSYENLMKILKSYKGRINKFLVADAYRQERNLIKGETPEKNDFIDVSHLLYLAHDSQIMVTNDRFLQSICENLFPNNYCSVDDFKNKYVWTS